MSRTLTHTERAMTRQAAFSLVFVGAALALAPVRIGLLTRMLSEADYGIFNLWTMTVAAIGFVALLGQRQYLIYQLPGKTSRERGEYALATCGVTLLSALGFALAFWGACRVFPAFGGSFSRGLVLMGAVYIVLYALAQLGMGYLLAVGEVVRYRLQVFLTTNLWLVALVPALLWFRPSLVQLAGLWLAGLVVPMAWILRWTLRSLGPEGRRARPVPERMKASAAYGLPLISRNIASSLMRLMDRYVILRFVGAAQMGLYTVPVLLVTYAADITYFLDFIFPHVSGRWQANRAAGRPGCSGDAAEYFHLALRLALLVTVPLATGILLWGTAVVRLLAGDAYAAVGYLFVLLVGQVVLIPFSNLLHFAMMLDGRTSRIGATIMGATVVNIGLNLALTPRLGLPGAAWAGTLSYVVLVAASLWAGQLLPHLRWRKLRAVPVLACCAAVAAAVLAGRRRFGFNLAGEMLLAAGVFLGAGFACRAWTGAELRGLLHRGGRDSDRPA